MIQENNLRTTAVFYTCGVCNLNCRYCNIDKNPILKEIDNKLGESFQGDYYFNRVKEYFPQPSMLRKIETWGGEPFLRMDRIYPLLRKIIEHYPYFFSMYSSTNFSYPTWLDQFFGLMNIFGEYPDRNFTYTLQLSVDGPEEINDYNRGVGVTKRCLENFNKLIAQLANHRLPENVELFIALKGTLDLDNIRALQTKDAIIQYYQFFENNYILPIKSLNDKHIFASYSIPNTAVPSPVTVNDGKLFANFCKLCREIESENQTQNYFKHYKTITPYTSFQACMNCTNYQNPMYGCGSGTSVIGFLPDNIVTTCHEGFIEIVDQYKEYAAQRDTENIVINFNHLVYDNKMSLSLTDDEYIKHEQKMSYFRADRATAQTATITAQIMALALAGQVDQKYLNEDEAHKAASYFSVCSSLCIKDNYNQTGSYTLHHHGLYKLLLNGALDYIYLERGGCTKC